MSDPTLTSEAIPAGILADPEVPAGEAVVEPEDGGEAPERTAEELAERTEPEAEDGASIEDDDGGEA
jgi:hypothetical protein